MLKDIINLLGGAMQKQAPKTFTRAMSPLQTLPSQAANLDVDFVAGAIASAQAGDITRLLALYRDIEVADGTISTAIGTRKLAVLARGWNVVAAPNSGDAGQRVADSVQAMLARSDSFVDACTWLLHGCIWPVAVVERRWVPGGTGYSHPEFRDVPLELFDYTQRTLRIKDVDCNGTPLSTTHTPTSSRYLIHRGHMLKAPDQWGGPLRALVFWFLFSTQDREWWARFLERFGSPFMKGTYDKNDDDSRVILQQAFQEATRLFGVVATSETNVEIVSAGNTAANGDAFKAFFDCAKDEKLMLILGQTLSSKASATGMGSGTADLQGQVRADIRLWDAFKLGNTIRQGVIEPWMRLNNIQGPAPVITFGGFEPGALTAMAEFLKALPAAGLSLPDDSLDVVSRHAGITLERVAAPAATPTLGAPVKDVDVAQTALNGAQIKSVVEVIQSVAQRTLPPDAAIELLQLALPSADPASLQRMMDAVQNSPVPPPVEVLPPAPAQQVAAAALYRHLLGIAAAGLPPSTVANEAVARDAAADLAQAFGDELAPLGEIITSSRSSAQLLDRAAGFLAGYRPGRSQEVLVRALAAAAANGLVSTAAQTGDGGE